MYYIDFEAIIKAYENDESARHDFNGIFAAVSSCIYWHKIAELQNVGVTDDNATFIELNKDNYCEKPDYVINRINVSLLKVVRFCTALNTDIARRGYSRFLTRIIKKDENGFWSLFDAQLLAMEIAQGYELYIGHSIMDTRWDLK